MIELAESITLAKQIKETLKGKKIVKILLPTNESKFTFFNPDLKTIVDELENKVITNAFSIGIFVEIEFDNNTYFDFNDGIVALYIKDKNKLPKKYQLSFVFDDDSALVFSVKLYGAFAVHDGNYDNEYYIANTNRLKINDLEFSLVYFKDFLLSLKDNESLKSALATKQRLPGLGNGSLQDILFNAKLSPKRKIKDLTESDIEKLYQALVSTTTQMIEQGGRDSEKDLFGNNGKYKTILSSKTYKNGCPLCAGEVKKEQYLGGSVYYCPKCQK